MSDPNVGGVARPRRRASARRLATTVVFAALAAAALLCASCGKKSGGTVHVGYQKYGMLLVLKDQGGLEKAFAESGVGVEWSEFPSGPPLLEALAAGKIDFGVAGEAPPVFAQASGASFVYVAADPPSPRAEAILVRRDSPIKSVADLRQKSIALNRGSNVHYLLVTALAEAGLKYSDVKTEFLPPSDARAAFDSGKVDAWVIWDPFLGAVLRSSDARVLRDGVGIASNVAYYLATPAFARDHRDRINVITGQIKQVDAQVAARPGDVAALLAGSLGMPADVVQDSLARSTFDIRALTTETVSNQQRVADAFFALGLLPRAIHVADAVSPGLAP